VRRIRASTVGFTKSDFLTSIRDSPDLYGPFWIASTLVFLVSAVGNFATWMSWRSVGASGAPNTLDWFLDADKAGWSVFLFYGYVSIVPTIVWAVFHVFKADLSLMQSVCLYGYSLALFIPVCLICAVPSAALQWMAILAAFGSTGWFLMSNLQAQVAHVASQAHQQLFRGKLSSGATRTVVAIFVTGFHLGLALLLGNYFFAFDLSGGDDVPAPTPAPTPVPTPAPTEALSPKVLAFM